MPGVAVPVPDAHPYTGGVPEPACLSVGVPVPGARPKLKAVS